MYLTADDVWTVHVGLADDFAREGKPFETSVLKPWVLDSAVNQPRQTFGGADIYPDPFAKSAALARGLICGHVFVDGNNRTGMEAALIFLEYNGWEVSFDKDEYVALALDIAGDRKRGKVPIEVEEIAGRLKKAARRIGR